MHYEGVPVSSYYIIAEFASVQIIFGATVYREYACVSAEFEVGGTTRSWHNKIVIYPFSWWHSAALVTQEML